jgi:hypothetical protein
MDGTILARRQHPDAPLTAAAKTVARTPLFVWYYFTTTKKPCGARRILT